jgi:hypothetical protein
VERSAKTPSCKINEIEDRTSGISLYNRTLSKVEIQRYNEDLTSVLEITTTTRKASSRVSTLAYY